MSIASLSVRLHLGGICQGVPVTSGGRASSTHLRLRRISSQATEAVIDLTSRRLGRSPTHRQHGEQHPKSAAPRGALTRPLILPWLNHDARRGQCLGAVLGAMRRGGAGPRHRARRHDGTCLAPEPPKERKTDTPSRARTGQRLCPGESSSPPTPSRTSRQLPWCTRPSTSPTCSTRTSTTSLFSRSASAPLASRARRTRRLTVPSPTFSPKERQGS